MSDENLNSLATVNIAHRTLPIVVGGNSSGRIHVFTSHVSSRKSLFFHIKSANFVFVNKIELMLMIIISTNIE